MLDNIDRSVISFNELGIYLEYNEFYFLIEMSKIT